MALVTVYPSHNSSPFSILFIEVKINTECCPLYILCIKWDGDRYGQKLHYLLSHLPSDSIKIIGKMNHCTYNLAIFSNGQGFTFQESTGRWYTSGFPWSYLFSYPALFNVTSPNLETPGTSLHHLQPPSPPPHPSFSPSSGPNLDTKTPPC